MSISWHVTRAFSPGVHTPPPLTQGSSLVQFTKDVSLPKQLTPEVVMGSVMLEMSNATLPGMDLLALKYDHYNAYNIVT